jgi:hypothetical protein
MLKAARRVVEIFANAVSVSPAATINLARWLSRQGDHSRADWPTEIAKMIAKEQRLDDKFRALFAREVVAGQFAK